MTFRRSIRLVNRESRNLAASQCHSADYGIEVIFRERTRTDDQNKKMHAMLTDIADQVDWHGQKLHKDDWKDWFMHALKRAMFVPDEEGGMVPVGMSTSRLRLSEMADLITLIEEFGERHGVVWRNEHHEN